MKRGSRLLGTGLFTTFQENRGLFLNYTFSDLLFRFPFGAGLGRWGMMNVYFPDPSMWHAPPIHVEIQPTGWLLDGGFPMWICYGGALASAVALAYRCARGGDDQELSYLAGVVLTFQASVIALCLTGPVFNTQLGVLFWTVTGALYGTIYATRDSGGGRSRLTAMTASRTRRLLAGVSVGYLNTIVVTVVGLWLTPYLLRHLDQHDYGLWLVCAQMLFYLSLTDVGVVALLPREVAFTTGRGGATTHDDLRQLVGATTRLVFWQLPIVAVLSFGTVVDRVGKMA